jgi:hypothetical protein
VLRATANGRRALVSKYVQDLGLLFLPSLEIFLGDNSGDKM